jgi:hypothetical protein
MCNISPITNFELKSVSLSRMQTPNEFSPSRIINRRLSLLDSIQEFQ